MRNVNNSTDVCQFQLDIAPRVEWTDIRLVHARAGLKWRSYNGAALNSRWDCILSTSAVLRGTDASNLLAQGTRRLPYASEVHGSSDRPGGRLARAGILTELYV